MPRRELIFTTLALFATMVTLAFGRGVASAAERVALAIGNGRYVNAKLLPNGPTMPS